MRLDPRPGEEIDRSRSLAFRWNGREYPAFRGDTIASALAASGERVFSRSFKYHRPRGIMTMSYLDPGCQVQVGAEPNVRAAHRLVEPGMDVRAQNVWPSLQLDVKAASGWLSPFLSAGFYYKTFMKPRFLWPLYQRVLRGMGTAGGRVLREVPPTSFDKRYAHPDVLVVGGGPAGLAAAAAAAEDGACVMLAEQEHHLGGHLRWGGAAELARLAAQKRALCAAGRVEVLLDSVVTGRYDDNWTAILQRGRADGSERLIKARAKTLVVAPGLIERPYVFEGNDKPGVMLSTAVRRLLNLYAVRPGRRAVVFTANAEGDAAAEELAEAGVDVVRIVDARRGERLRRAIGRGRVTAVELTDGSRLAADLLVTAVGWTSPTSLLNMAGEVPVYDPRAARYFPRQPSQLPEGVLATGGIVGDGSHDELLAHARAIGREASRRARLRAAELQQENPRRTRPIASEPAPDHQPQHRI